MNPLTGTSHPKLRTGCRLRESGGADDNVLLIPEGALRLAGTGRKIVERCDGQHTLDDIVRELKAEYPSAEPGRIESEVSTFLDRLYQKRVIDV